MTEVLSTALTEWAVVWPILTLFVFGSIAVLFWRKPASQAVVGLIGMGVYLAAAMWLFWSVWTQGTQIMTMGNWGPPFGITFVADLFGSGLVLLTAFSGLMVALYALGDMDRPRKEHGFYPLLLLLLAGLTGAFLTGDLFNLYVWFEVILISSFGLLILGGRKEQIDGAVKYAVLNLIATTLFLIATGMIYGVAGTLNMADLSTIIPGQLDNPIVATIGVLFLLAFATKAAAFPVAFWLPASYHTPNAAVSAIFAALLTKVGVYALFRIFTLIFPIDQVGLYKDIFLGLALVTMVLGALGALVQNDLRRIVSYSVIAGIGFMLLGLGLGSQPAMMGAIFYLAHSILISCALFMASGLIHRSAGTSDLRKAAGLYRAAPLLGILFILAGFAVAGIPPFSGFWPKVFLLKAALDLGVWAAAALSLLAGLITLIAVVRVWVEAFWRREEDAAHAEASSYPAAAGLGGRTAMMGSLAVLVVTAAAMGFWAAPVVAIADRSAAELTAPQAYVDSVLSTRPAFTPMTLEQRRRAADKNVKNTPYDEYEAPDQNAPETERETGEEGSQP